MKPRTFFGRFHVPTQQGVPALIEDAPMYRATITVRRPFKMATAQSPGTRVSVAGQTVEAVVDEVHEVIEIR